MIQCFRQATIHSLPRYTKRPINRQISACVFFVTTFITYISFMFDFANKRFIRWTRIIYLTLHTFIYYIIRVTLTVRVNHKQIRYFLWTPCVFWWNDTNTENWRVFLVSKLTRNRRRRRRRRKKVAGKGQSRRAVNGPQWHVSEPSPCMPFPGTNIITNFNSPTIMCCERLLTQFFALHRKIIKPLIILQLNFFGLGIILKFFILPQASRD